MLTRYRGSFLQEATAGSAISSAETGVDPEWALRPVALASELRLYSSGRIAEMRSRWSRYIAVTCEGLLRHSALEYVRLQRISIDIDVAVACVCWPGS